METSFAVLYIYARGSRLPGAFRYAPLAHASVYHHPPQQQHLQYKPSNRPHIPPFAYATLVVTTPRSLAARPKYACTPPAHLIVDVFRYSLNIPLRLSVLDVFPLVPDVLPLRQRNLHLQPFSDGIPGFH